MDYNNAQNSGYGYGKRPLWQWVLIYVVVALVVYGGVYYFFFAKNNFTLLQFILR